MATLTADCAGNFRATMQSATAPNLVRFPLPPNIPLLNHLRQKSRSRAMSNSRPLYEFVGEIPPDLLCGICLLVPHEPHRVSCCGRFFCQLCITEWTLAQRYQCPSCFRPNCSHRSDTTLSQRVLHLPIYCTSRHKGCTWQGLMRDLQVHLSSEDGCFFTLVECPLVEFGCQPRTIQRRDLSKHMADMHSGHMRMILGNLKHTSSRLDSQERALEDLQQHYALFFSQVSCTLQTLTCNASKTSLMLQDFGRLKVKVAELEDALLKVRPHSLTRLDRALSDTFPPLKYFEGDGLDGAEEEEEMSLNGSLLHGLREVKVQSAGVGEGVWEGGSEGEGAGLPIGGDLPTEVAASAQGEGEEGKEGGCEGVKGVTELSELEGEMNDEMITATEIDESLEKNNDIHIKMNSDLPEPVVCTLNPTPCSSIQPTYATAVSNPFHPVLKGSSTVSKCPDSIPTNVQTLTCTSRPLQSTTVTTALASNTIHPATITLDTSSDTHEENKEQSLPSNNHHDNHQTEPQYEDTQPPKNEFQAGQESGLDRANLVVQLTDVLGEGFGAIASSGPAGWSEWGEGVCSRRCDSSFSLHSSSSSETSFVGDTVIQYGTSTVVVSTTSGKKSPSPDHTQVKLFVKYMPHCCSPEKAVSLFLAYGTVHLLEYHSEHRDKLFLIMDREGGLQAMSALNGTRLEGSPKPLSVQLYRTTPTSATPIIQRPDFTTTDKTLRLFVKYLCSDMTTQDIADLFSAYGKVFDVQKHPNRRNVAFVYMCQEGGRKAIVSLNGYHSSQITRPLVVELSHEPTAPTVKPSN